LAIKQSRQFLQGQGVQLILNDPAPDNLILILVDIIGRDLLDYEIVRDEGFSQIVDVK
jgi:hypothetical protein